jgi:thioredoxin-related protein
MKVLVSIIFFVQVVLSDAINWQDSYSQAMQKSKEFFTPMFIMVSADDDPESQYMLTETLSNKELSEYININYISYKFKFKSKEIPQNMRMWGVPRFYFTTSEGKILYQHFGAIKQKELQKELHQIVKKYKKILRDRYQYKEDENTTK